MKGARGGQRGEFSLGSEMGATLRQKVVRFEQWNR